LTKTVLPLGCFCDKVLENLGYKGNFRGKQWHVISKI